MYRGSYIIAQEKRNIHLEKILDSSDGATYNGFIIM